MKLSLLSFNMAKHLPLPEMLELAQTTGFEAVEFRGDAQHMHGVEVDTKPADRARIRKTIEDSGLTPACIATGTRFEFPKEWERREHIERTKRFIELAADIGALHIRVFGNAFPKGVEKQDVIRWCGEGLAELGEFAQGYPVDVGLEMHGDFYYWQYALESVQIANHPKVFIIPNCDGREADDSGSIRTSYEGVKDHVRHIHMHEIDNPKGFNYKEFFGLLKRDGYEGYMSAEIQPSDDPPRVLGLYVALWREMVANAQPAE